MGRQPGKPRRPRYRTALGCRTPDYTQLPDAVRQRRRSAARAVAEQAALGYADLLAAEAGIAARAVYPTLGRLVFRLSADVFGASATLVAAYTDDGLRLWHVDTDDEWPDESLVGDFLAAAADAVDEYFPAATADVTADEDGELWMFDVRPPRRGA